MPDMPTQMGSPIYKGHQSHLDSSAVGILRAAGALIFGSSSHQLFRVRVKSNSNMAGKTTTTEFCVTNSGPNTTNPHDPNRTPGGSSCGSAAAVADLHVPVALGAQTGGSIIRPASYTGVFALKPTYNAVSPEGTKVFSPTFDTLGFLTRSVNDLQLLADVFALNDDEPVQDIPLGEASVALIKTPMWGREGPGTIAAMDKAERILRDNGVKVQDVSFPAPLDDVDGLKRLHKVIISADAQRAFLREYRVDKAHLHPEIQRLVENSANFTHRETLQALDTLASMRPIVDDLAANYSAILTPSVVDEAPLGLGDMGSAVFNTLWTASALSFQLAFRFFLTNPGVGLPYARPQCSRIHWGPWNAHQRLSRRRQIPRSAPLENRKGPE